MFKNIFPKDVFSRSFYEKVTVISVIPFYLFSLFAMHNNWLILTEDFLPRYLLLFSGPILLATLYLTSHKKMFPQRIGDCLYILVFVSIIASSNTTWGGPMRVDGPLFPVYMVLIPFFVILLDPFLFYFTAGIINFSLIIESLLKPSAISFLPTLDLFFKLIVLFILALVSANLVKKILIEREAIQKLQKAHAELKKLDTAKSEFISIASHQLRTPLSAIKGYAAMTLRGTYGEIPKRAKKPLESVYQSTERLIKLVNDLLSVSRIETGKMEMELERVPLEDIISSVVDELKLKAEEKNLYLNWRRPKKALPKISVDKDKVRQSLFNVIDNAIKYTEKGGATIKLKSSNSSLIASVSDTGVGLTKEEFAHLFESFSRGKAGTRFWSEGIGLGLYIARRLVEMHNGKIWAESPGKGKGSTFYIELPVK